MIVLLLVVFALFRLSNALTEVQILQKACDAWSCSTNGNFASKPWDINTNPDKCNWYGIKCKSGVVVELLLSKCSLSGTIPTELGQLTDLKQLGLYTNSLSGTIPSELGQLTALTILRIQNNRFRRRHTSEQGKSP